MSMSLFMGLQCAWVFLLYMLVTVGLPAIVFGKRFMHLKTSERFVSYFIIGNFFVMNLVFILQLLKISNRFTLVLSTVVISVAVYSRVQGISAKNQLLSLWTSFDRILSGTLGLKTVLYQSARNISVLLKKAWRKIIELFLPDFLEWLLIVVFFLIFLKIYGIDIITNYGYSASDMPVHNYWINYLSRKKIFVAGVYPFGFHCIIYYLHEVFNIDTYIVLRVFCLTQNFLVIIMMLCLLKYCCRTKYAPYIALVVYTVADIFAQDTYLRFYSTLPQEFGMLFIYPAVYFAFAFFKEKEEDRPSLWYLCGFAMSFFMTLEVHFYDTIIVGMFCVAIAIGFFSRFIQWKYFKYIILTCAISVLAAILPMGIALATGTHLQGSLNWGMKVLRGEIDGTAAEHTEDENIGETVGETILRKTEVYVFNDLGRGAVILFYGMVAELIAAGIAMVLFRQKDYGDILISTGVFMIFMVLLLISRQIGFPTLMDSSRCSIYFAYSAPLVMTLVIDHVLFSFFGWMFKIHLRWIMHIVSFVVLVAIAVFFQRGDMLRQAEATVTLETNEAVTCLTNIIHENDDFHWTICSTNDELRMGEDHGYHYEIIDFLRRMEGTGDNAMLTIPTEFVYFFIEKKPLDYTEEYEGSGQSVSEQLAGCELPKGKNLSIYEGENRGIVMSRMYYWAQEFCKMYPNEMKVYMETEDFVCYKIRQNMYRLYNFAIDYGYNTQDYEQEMIIEHVE